MMSMLPLWIPSSTCYNCPLCNRESSMAGPSHQIPMCSKLLVSRLVQHDVRWWISTHQLRFPKLRSPWSHLWKVGHAASNQSLCEHMVFTFVLATGNSFAHLVKAAESFQPVFYVGVNLLAKIWMFSWLLHFSIAVIAKHALLKMFTLKELLIADVDCLYC